MLSQKWLYFCVWTVLVLVSNVTFGAHPTDPLPQAKENGLWFRGKFYGTVAGREKGADASTACVAVARPSSCLLDGSEPENPLRPKAVVEVSYQEEEVSPGQDDVAVPETREEAESEEDAPPELSPELSRGPVGQPKELLVEPLSEVTSCAAPVCCTLGCADVESCHRPWIWGRAEYLLWWTEGNRVPPLATTSLAGTTQDSAGVLGLSSTSVLFGESSLHSAARSGGRYTLGAWFDPCECHGLEASFLHVAEDSDVFQGSSNEYGILARPFYDTVSATEDADLLVYPTIADGALTVDSSTRFQSFEFLYRTVGYRSPCGNVDYYLGYRFLGLDELLQFNSTTTALTQTGTPTTALWDEFETETAFHGGVIGAVVELPAGPCWSCEATTKLALGNARYRTSIAGGRTVGSTSYEGGLLAQDTNIGTYQWDEFSAASEFGLTLRRQLQCGWEFRFGYNVIYWAKVARSGDQIDRDVNTARIPPGTLTGTARPTFHGRMTSFWAQGMSFGLEYSY